MFYSPYMGTIDYIDQPCRSALNSVRGMPFRWSLNPYRGCSHGCHYCYARATHPYLGLNAGDDFSTRIVVKTNIAEVLQKELRKSSWRRERVAIGTATDAYQPCEGRYRLTRRCLEALADRETPVSIVTKSTLIVRDLDLLIALTKGPGVSVFFTITTLDAAVWRFIEPGTPPPGQRLRVMARLREAGVRTGVFLAPVLPGITDSEASLDAVAAAARDHGAVILEASVLRLVPEVKSHYLRAITEQYPQLLSRYEQAYAGANAPDAYQTVIARRLASIRARYGFAQNEKAGRDEGGGNIALIAAGGTRVRQLALGL